MSTTKSTPSRPGQMPLWTMALIGLEVISVEGVIKKRFADEVAADEKVKAAIQAAQPAPLSGFQGQDNYTYPAPEGAK